MFMYHFAGLPTLCLKEVWKLRDALNVRVTAGYRPAQTQEEPAGWGVLFLFLSGVTEILLQNIVTILEF